MTRKQLETLKLQLSTITLLDAAADNLDKLRLGASRDLTRRISEDIRDAVLDLQIGAGQQ